MSIFIVPKTGGFVIWLFKGRRANRKDEMGGDGWLNWVVGYITMIVFLFLLVFLFNRCSGKH